MQMPIAFSALSCSPCPRAPSEWVNWTRGKSGLRVELRKRKAFRNKVSLDQRLLGLPKMWSWWWRALPCCRVVIQEHGGEVFCASMQHCLEWKAAVHVPDHVPSSGAERGPRDHDRSAYTERGSDASRNPLRTGKYNLDIVYVS